MLLSMELLVYIEFIVFAGFGVIVLLMALKELLAIFFKKGIDLLFNILTSEWILRLTPNGGIAVILRTAFTGTIVSGLVFLAYILFWKFFKDAPCDCNHFLFENWWKFCGVYAAVYTSFYARFVSQWTYLSNLYNQIKNADMDLCKSCGKNDVSGLCGKGCNSAARKKIDGWKAGFIEDAEALHMETKSIFATVIYIWLMNNPNIEDIYKKSHAKLIMNQQDADEHYDKLVKRIKNKLKDA